MNFMRTQVTDTNRGSRNKNQFTADSKLHCEACDTDVHVGTSGTSNLNAHRDSITCKENKAANALPPQKKDKSHLSFFSRKTIQLGRSQVHLTDSETNERAPEDNSTGQRTSGRVRKRTQVDGRCECDVEITADEKEEGTRVMMCKAPGCKTGWVRVILQLFSCVVNF